MQHCQNEEIKMEGLNLSSFLRDRGFNGTVKGLGAIIEKFFKVREQICILIFKLLTVSEIIAAIKSTQDNRKNRL